MKKVFYLTIFLLIFSVVAVSGEDNNTNSPIFSFGTITDCHFDNTPKKGQRHYHLAGKKLKEAIKHFNSQDLDFIINLGDFINKNFSSLSEGLSITNLSKSPVYFILGNHDLYVSDINKEKVVDKLGLQKRYYEFKIKNWRLIALDGNDLSLYAYPKGTDKYRKNAAYFKKHAMQYHSKETYSFGIGPGQLSWLANRLDEASFLKENVIIFCHFPIYPKVKYPLSNANELMVLIQKYSCVKAYISGHYHSGNYGLKDGIHYLTLKAMVDTKENAYAVINVFNNRLDLRGFKREQSRVMLLK